MRLIPASLTRQRNPKKKKNFFLLCKNKMLEICFENDFYFLLHSIEKSIRLRIVWICSRLKRFFKKIQQISSQEFSWNNLARFETKIDQFQRLQKSNSDLCFLPNSSLKSQKNQSKKLWIIILLFLTIFNEDFLFFSSFHSEKIPFPHFWGQGRRLLLVAFFHEDEQFINILLLSCAVGRKLSRKEQALRNSKFWKLFFSLGK